MNVVINRKIEHTSSPDEIVKEILKIRSIEESDSFFNPIHPEKTSFASFFENQKDFAKQLKQVTDLLTQIKQDKGTIVVYSDYDADGLTGGAIVWETLHLLGFNVMPHVPDRKTEGYGFSKVGIDMVHKKHNPQLIISVDHGIAAADKIEYAHGLGIPIVITDHHQKSDVAPDKALAIFHTDQLSGSGVAYFFAREIYNHFSKKDIKPQLDSHFKNDYLGLAAIGLVADMVPLTGSARSVVKHGLASLSKSKRHGIVALLKDSGIDNKPIGTYEVGFMIAPRINAFGRIADALDSLRLLCTTNSERAKALATMATEINSKRQKLVEKACKQAFEMVDPFQKCIVVYNPDWEEGIIGLIASKLVGKFSRPALVLSKSNTGIKGSARSVNGFDITSFLRQSSKHLTSVGGHKGAAGLSLKTESLDALLKKIQKIAETEITDEMLVEKINVDISMPLSLATMTLGEKLESLAPYGIGNPKPVFHSVGTVIDIKLMGKLKNHLKLMVKSENSFPLEVIFFNDGAKSASWRNNLTKGQKIEIVYTLEINRWNGSEKITGMGKYLSKN